MANLSISPRLARKEQIMLKTRLVSVVNICTRHAWPVIVMAVLLTLATSFYSFHNFSINTDVNRLISSDLPWRQQELVVDRAFAHRKESILAVVEARTSELATQASTALFRKLSEQKTLFTSIRSPAESEFFSRNGLLFVPTEGVEQTTRN
jgi:predicted RND superfamily exporter protein